MAKGLILKKGTIADSNIIEVPSSMKNKNKERDADSHQVKKGNVWHFGYKVHIGVGKDSSLAHTVEVTGANIHDATMVLKLLTGTEETASGNLGYLGAEKHEDAITLNLDGKKIRYKTTRRPSPSKNMSVRSRAQIKRREHEKIVCQGNGRTCLWCGKGSVSIPKSPIPRVTKTNDKTECSVCSGKPHSG